jgi:hypothetical protein
MAITEAMLIESATKVVVEMLVKKFETINLAQQRSNISDRDLIAFDNRSTRGRLPKEVQASFEDMRHIVRSSLYLLAKDIDNDRVYLKDLEEADVSILTQNHLERLLTFAESMEEFLISHKTLAIIFRYVKDCNRKLHAKAQIASRTGDAKTNLRSVAMSAILIHEILAIIVDYLETFELSGVEEIYRIYREVAMRIQDLEARDDELEQDIKQQLHGDRAQLARQLGPISNRREVRSLTLKKWDEILRQVDHSKDNTTNMLAQLPRLKLLKRNAAIHVETAQLVALTEAMSRDIDALAELANVGDLELVPFSITDVKSILNIG